MSSAKLRFGSRRGKVRDDSLCVRKEQALYVDRSVVICAGAATEVEALKKALAEA